MLSSNLYADPQKCIQILQKTFSHTVTVLHSNLQYLQLINLFTGVVPYFLGVLWGFYTSASKYFVVKSRHGAVFHLDWLRNSVIYTISGNRYVELGFAMQY